MKSVWSIAALVGLLLPSCGTQASDLGPSSATPLQASVPPSPMAQAMAEPGFDPSYLLHPFLMSKRPVLRQSVFVFGGMMASTDIWSTAIFNLNRSGQRTYDNAIVGAAYQRDVVQLNSGLTIGGEIGIADRFGHYRTDWIYSGAMANSAELWGGFTFRYGIDLFHGLRMTPGLVFGLSAISSPIGQEGWHQKDSENATTLFYLALEAAFAMTDHPDTELVIRLHHRSGAYGILGGMKEGNNANTFGVRQYF